MAESSITSFAQIGQLAASNTATRQRQKTPVKWRSYRVSSHRRIRFVAGGDAEVGDTSSFYTSRPLLIKDSLGNASAKADSLGSGRFANLIYFIIFIVSKKCSANVAVVGVVVWCKVALGSCALPRTTRSSTKRHQRECTRPYNFIDEQNACVLISCSAVCSSS